MKFKEKGQQAQSIIQCPQCAKPVVYSVSNLNRPFCSRLCKLEDLSAWAQENYKVKGKEAPNSDLYPSSHETETFS